MAVSDLSYCLNPITGNLWSLLMLPELLHRCLMCSAQILRSRGIPAFKFSFFCLTMSFQYLYSPLLLFCECAPKIKCCGCEWLDSHSKGVWGGGRKEGRNSSCLSQGLVEGLRPICMWMDAGAAFSHQYPLPSLLFFFFFCPSPSLTRTLTASDIRVNGQNGSTRQEGDRERKGRRRGKEVSLKQEFAHPGISRSTLLQKQEKH